MKKNLFLLLMSFLCISCARSIVGSKHIISNAREVSVYSQVKVFGSFDVVLTDGQVGHITVKAPDNIEPYVLTEVKNGVLSIGMAPENTYQSIGEVVVYVPVDSSLKEIKLSGSGDLASLKELSLDKLKCQLFGSGDIGLSLQANSVEVSLEGSGDIRLIGKANELKATVSGSGDFLAEDFRVNKAELSLSGSADIDVFVAEEVVATVSGSGDITIKGNPQKRNTKVRGSGDIEFR